MAIRGKAMLLTGGALVAGALVWAFRPQPIAVDLSQVTRGDLRVTIDEEGMTRVRDRYVVAAPVAGRLQRIALRPGDPVSAGTTVVAAFLPATPAPLDPRTRAETLSRLKAAHDNWVFACSTILVINQSSVSTNRGLSENPNSIVEG